MQYNAHTGITDYKPTARCCVLRRLAINHYARSEERGALKFEGYSCYHRSSGCYKTVAETCDHTTYQFLCVSEFHAPRYMQYLLQKFAYLDLVYVLS